MHHRRVRQFMHRFFPVSKSVMRSFEFFDHKSSSSCEKPVRVLLLRWMRISPTDKFPLCRHALIKYNWRIWFPYILRDANHELQFPLAANVGLSHCVSCYQARIAVRLRSNRDLEEYQSAQNRPNSQWINISWDNYIFLKKRYETNDVQNLKYLCKNHIVDTKCIYCPHVNSFTAVFLHPNKLWEVNSLQH